MSDDIINPQWHIDVTKLTTDHLRNRIAWAKRQLIDTWQIHGDERRYGAGGFTDTIINLENDEIEEHIKAMEEELKNRPSPVEIPEPTLNEQFGFLTNFHHDIDEQTKDCKKCHKNINELRNKLCPIVGSEEFHNYGDFTG